MQGNVSGVQIAEVVQFMGGTYIPVTVSYRTLTQSASNVQIGWDRDGIYYEY